LLDQLTYYEGIYDFSVFNVENPAFVDDATVVVPDTTEEVKIQEALPQEPKPSVKESEVPGLEAKKQDRLENFNIDYSKIKLPRVDLETHVGHPIFSILKTINSYSKILVTRLKFTQAQDAIVFCKKAYALLVEMPEDQLLHTVTQNLELS